MVDPLSGEVSANDVLLEAIKAFQQGNLDGAEGLTTELLTLGFQHRYIYELAGHISLAVKEYARAMRYFGLALQLEPEAKELQSLLQETRELSRRYHEAPRRIVPRYLLIREWGYGFCSDLNHVLGGLLLAELTQRIPMVFWGEASRFRDDGDTNAWNNFFKPVSPAEPSELVGKGLSYFPASWNDENFLRSDANRRNDLESTVAGFRYLNMPQEIAIADVHIGIVDLVPWIRPESPFAHHSIEDLYQYLVAKYIRIVPKLANEVEAFWNRHIAGRPSIAVHARGGDKYKEIAEHEAINEEVFESTLAAAKQQPLASIFLLTDDARILAKYVKALGERVITTDCRRISADRGIHRTTTTGKRQLGDEIVRDMYLAARCDQFIGAGTTNVASMIAHLKPWPKESLILHGMRLHETRNLFALNVFAP